MSRVVFEQAAELIEQYRRNYVKRHTPKQQEGQPAPKPAVPPSLNVISTKYDLADIIRDIGFTDASELLDYFFRTTGAHDIKRFIYNYHDLLEHMRRTKADEARKQSLLRRKLS